MVLREKKISNKSDNVQLHLSYGLPDVKMLLRLYGNIEGVSEEILRTIQHTEQDVRFWFEHDGRAFLSFQDKWREQLSAWAFAVAVRNKLLIPTAVDENKYYLSPSLFIKRGRPPQND